MARRQPGASSGRLLYVFGPVALSEGIQSRFEPLTRIPAFRNTVARWDEVVSRQRGWSPLEMVEAGALSARVPQQEGLLVLECVHQISLYHLLETWDLHPAGVAGLGTGAITAYYAAGGFTLEDALHGCLAWLEGRQVALPPHGAGRVPVYARATGAFENEAPGPAASTDGPSLSVQPREVARVMEAALAGAYDAVLNLSSSAHWDHALQELAQQASPPVPHLPVLAREEYTLFATNAVAELRAQGYDLPSWLVAKEGDTSSHQAPHPSVPGTTGAVSAPETPVPAAPRRSGVIPTGVPRIHDLETEVAVCDLHRFFQARRELGPLHYLEAQDGWLLLNYDDIASVLKNTDAFSNAPYRSFNKLLSGADPPGHTRARHKLVQYFSRQRIMALRDMIDVHARRAMDELGRLDTFDLVRDLTDPLPQAISCDFLGIDPEQFGTLPARLHENPAWSTLASVLTGRGLLREIQNAGELDEEEMVDLARFLMGAGVLTLHDFLGMAVYSLLGRPQWLQRIRAEPDLIPDVVEELLRLDPPVLTLQRQVKEPVTLHGVELEAGEMVYLAIGAANRDPAHFEQPDELILRRSGSRHLSFSVGPHYCMGDRLGRLEAEIILKLLLTDMPPFRPLMPLSDVSFKGGLHMRGLTALPLAWERDV